MSLLLAPARLSCHTTIQSSSKPLYTISGDAYGWFTVGKPEAYYGDSDEDGNDVAPGNTWDLIRDAVGVINGQGAVPWQEYDVDGNCVLDHVLVIQFASQTHRGIFAGRYQQTQRIAPQFIVTEHCCLQILLQTIVER